MRLLLISTSAVEDLRQAWHSAGIDRADAGDALLDDIMEAAQHLTQWPEMGRRRPDLLPDLRCLVAGKHLIFYRVTTRAIEIVRVVHGRRDLDAIF